MKRVRPHRMSRGNPVLMLLVLIAALVTGLVHLSAPERKSGADMQGVVEYVYDGDTFRLTDQRKVRLIGIDTPESRENPKLHKDARRSGQDVATILKAGREASQFTRELLQGQRVRLETDVQTHDRYGRLLAYVYLEDGTFVNARIIASGYASLMTIPPNVQHADEFRDLLKEARKKRLGLWKDGSF